MKILMVCLGNICRSPLAEGILKHRASQAGLSWSIDSAGTNYIEETDIAPHHLSQKVALANGIDIRSQRARSFTAADLHAFDKIYAMANNVVEEMKHIAGSHYQSAKVELLLNELYPGHDMDVPDPWFFEEPGYHEVYSMIDRSCEKIIARYA